MTPQHTPSPVVASFWDQPTGSWQYVFHDPATMTGAIVDPVWDFDPLSGATGLRNARLLLEHVKQAGIKVEWILDTHPHADHFSAAPWLAQQLGAKTAIGDHVTKVQKLWQKIYHLPDDFPTDGRQWDRLFADGETFQVGNLSVRLMLSAGQDAPDTAAFQALRDARDATLPLPKLLLAALQINIRGGRAPDPEADGRSYLKLPLDYFEPR